MWGPLAGLSFIAVCCYWLASSVVYDVPILFALLRLVVVLVIVVVLMLGWAMVEEALAVKRQWWAEQAWRLQSGVAVATGSAQDLVRVTQGAKAAAFWEAEQRMWYRTADGVTWEIPQVGYVVSHLPSGEDIRWCVDAKGVPATDRMLAILLMLQTDEAAFGRVANRVG